MSEKEKLGQNEPAFPCELKDSQMRLINIPGMSKRYYTALQFAKVFAQEYLKGKDSKLKHELNNPMGICKIAFKFADELLQQENL